jgi:hypothetical protein
LLRARFHHCSRHVKRISVNSFRDADNYSSGQEMSRLLIIIIIIIIIVTPWPQSASELYRPRDCRLSAKLVPTFEDRGCRVASSSNPKMHLRRSRKHATGPYLKLHELSYTLFMLTRHSSVFYFAFHPQLMQPFTPDPSGTEICG